MSALDVLRDKLAACIQVREEWQFYRYTPETKRACYEAIDRLRNQIETAEKDFTHV